MIKAIETHWKGYRFRSRLEARWAVFFEELGWKWKYEHQGYNIGWEQPAKWLPDFEVQIPQSFGMNVHAYVEVKGNPKFLSDGEFANTLDFGGGPPGFCDSKRHLWCGSQELWAGQYKPVLFLGDIPQNSNGTLFIPMLCHSKGVHAIWVAVTSSGIETIPAQMLYEMNFQGGQTVSNITSGLGCFQPKIVSTTLGFMEVVAALNKAKSARFEHGESPRVRA